MENVDCLDQGSLAQLRTGSPIYDVFLSWDKIRKNWLDLAVAHLTVTPVFFGMFGSGSLIGIFGVSAAISNQIRLFY